MSTLLPKIITVSTDYSNRGQYLTRNTIQGIVKSHFERRENDKVRVDPTVLSICDSLQEHTVHSLLDLIASNASQDIYQRYSSHLSTFFQTFNTLHQQLHNKPLEHPNQVNFESIFALDTKLSELVETSLRRMNQPLNHIRLVDVLLSIDHLFLSFVDPDDRSEDALRPYEFCQQFREDCLETLVTIISSIDTSNEDQAFYKQLIHFNDLFFFSVPFANDIFECPFELQTSFIDQYLMSYSSKPRMTFFAKLCLVIVCFSLTHMITYDAKVSFQRKGASKYTVTDYYILQTVCEDPILRHLFKNLRFVVHKESKHVQ